MPKRLLIVEEALKNRRGHWYEYNLAIASEARRQGIEVTVLAHRDIEEDLRLELKAVPFFPATSWDGVYYHPSIWRRYIGLLRHNLLVARLVGRHFARNEPYDVVLVPTVVLYHWLAWRWLAWRYGKRCFQKLVLTTRNNAGEYDPVTRGYQYKSSAKVLKKAVQSFAPLVKSGLVEMASDSAVLCRQYEGLCGVPFHPYPHPRTIPISPLPLPNQERPRSLVFSALGPPRFEKGSDLVLEAVSLVRQRRPDLNIRFVLQWTDRLLRFSGQEILPSAEMIVDTGVELLKFNLSSAQYLERLQQTDVMLVPYRRDQYHARLSGVAIEAFQAGVPCICISNTWIAEAMEKLGSGIAVDNESAEALAQAMITIAGNYTEYKQRALERAPKARSTHAPEAFVCQLMKGSEVGRRLPVGNSSSESGEAKRLIKGIAAEEIL